MSRLRPFRSRVGVAGAAGLAALSLLVTSLTPLALRASAAEESTQATDVVSSQDGATASSDSEAAAAPAAANGAYLPKTSPRAVKKPARPPAISHTALRTYGTVRAALMRSRTLKTAFSSIVFSALSCTLSVLCYHYTKPCPQENTKQAGGF